MATTQSGSAATAPSAAPQPAVVVAEHSPAPAPPQPHPPAASRSQRRVLIWIAAAVGLVAVLWFGIPLVRDALNTVSTDDAYVNSHVTFVAPRVAGQVTSVLVDDNNRVEAGQLLVELDPQPFKLVVDVQQAALDAANADLTAAKAQVRSYVGQARSARFKLQQSIEQVDNQVAQLRARVALYQTKQATLARAKADFERGQQLLPTNAISKEDFDLRQANYRVAEADATESLEEVYQLRALLGLPRVAADPKVLAQAPDDLDQTQSSVREAMYTMLQAVAQLGVYPPSYTLTPKEVIDDFLKKDKNGDINVIYDKLVKDAPAAKQAETKVKQAEAALAQAQLNLSYCKIYADIDGQVTRRNVNPGNNVQIGQALMAVRSFDVWVDANFKETQLEWLRIGQPAELYVDMYGSKYVFKGRVSGFTMGTGSTLALLPAENATGNFVKVVQRLPVRIDLTEPNPLEHPLFVGLSVTPVVYIHEKPTGPDAGDFLQPIFAPPADRQSSEPSAIGPNRAPTTGPTPSPSPAPPAGNLPATTAPVPPGPSATTPTKP